MKFEGRYDKDVGRRIVLVDGRELDLPALLPGELRHSPTGLNWGYHGSGPAELARAILTAVFPDQPAVRHPLCYQQFKVDYIAGLGDEWIITEDAVVGWYLRWQRTRLAREAERDAPEPDHPDAAD